MSDSKFELRQHDIGQILNWFKSGEIAIPEIQRPFVWTSTKVRDLLDSLYRGYPVGYVIVWQNPNVRLMDGSLSLGKKIVIDGQQRIIALAASILGYESINRDYEKKRIKIAYHPLEEKFEVSNPAIEGDSSWIPDISTIISKTDIFEDIQSYSEKNNVSNEEVFNKVSSLKKITDRQLGLIELRHELDIETVTEIFIRINSKGVSLGQADFAMSKIASNEIYNGHNLRKCIDYFCRCAVKPEFYDHIEKSDEEFKQTEFISKISWLKKKNDDLCEPSYSDLLRVAFVLKFNRGKLADLVSLLSGRDFEKKTYTEEIAKKSFEQLKEGILSFINERNFKNFLMIIRSAGFIVSSQIGAKNAFNFSYAIYLKLKEEKYRQPDIQKYVKKWLVLSLLTKRYSGSSETAFDRDIKTISEKGMANFLQETEGAELSDAFWNVGLVQDLTTDRVSTPAFQVYLAAQCKNKSRAFLSRGIAIDNLMKERGDIHHIFPKDFLKKKGLRRGKYNQVANYAYTESEVNISISNKEPFVYLKEAIAQCNGDTQKYGDIADERDLMKNLRENDVPKEIIKFKFEDYEHFLEQRRKLISQKIKKYYEKL